MVISVNKEVTNADFESLLKTTVKTLADNSQKETERYIKLLGNKLEGEVFDVMNSSASGTPFEGTIELISGQKFPDIIANNFFGVEVKSTKQNHWRTTGNSILESTRVEDIQKIYMLFGKIHEPIEFKCRPYEECLYDVIVTHSPRYAVDMDLENGGTIFDRVDASYDTIRKSTNPVKYFKDYYRSRLTDGQELWWLDNEEYKPESLVFKLWKTLSKEERQRLKIEGRTFFPETLSNKHKIKYDRFTMWLSVKKRIICPNVRDEFSAGGQEDRQIGATKLERLPKAISNLIDDIKLVSSLFNSTSLEQFNEIWKSNFLTRDELKNEWLDCMLSSATTVYDFGTFNFRNWLKDQLDSA
ncbi:hypothetical protein [Carboxylicivirga sp. RSCT41]|uniref:hypothetical protein n=1 Tax=Carboxylicivirga agarovorans TaxID=3417570 RepID=UPI003D34DDA2